VRQLRGHDLSSLKLRQGKNLGAAEPQKQLRFCGMLRGKKRGRSKSFSKFSIRIFAKEVPFKGGQADFVQYADRDSNLFTPLGLGMVR
jgi:hypothetical protein